MNATPLAIKTDQVGRIYQKKSPKRKAASEESARELIALDGVTLEVPKGELFGLLGPNGAGKTTLIKVLTTLLTPTSGTALVEGFDVVQQAKQVRERINMVSGGETSGYGLLTVRENLWMFSQFYGVPTKEAYRRADALLEKLELSHMCDTRVSGLSTGERQRMNFCRGFITEPNVLFLDEPTLGLDVNIARITRSFTREWMREHPDRTVLLTTHYMAEADELCDRIAIIDHGRIIACDSPQSLKRMLQRQPIFEITAGGLDASGIAEMRASRGVVRLTESFAPELSHHTLNFILEEESALPAIVGVLAATGGRLVTLAKHEPTLEDVFVKLVGRSLKEEVAE
ncbi:MAG: ATP-binding cassette domain-containing protein [Bacteroidota bacterium]|nr:ATP-binding cassette domain-containing protein [Bacteroidota bacterium]MDP4234643.1 ATP-binding cassette domain-containing protein [Bacteroidota bacterium]MDP4243808.1 ATP-binding cassette domain-containing protein [Bacteroidota bacterium]MDP4288601.1 ATP-binding cassette domain-containing protein [Bacteroidota bacterium]